MQPERADMTKDLGALSGSRADASSPQAVSTEGFDPARLRALAVRLESNVGPSRALDREIQCRHRADGLGPAMQPRRFTASVDEARLLVPATALWAIGNMEEGPFARLCWPMPDGSYSGGYVEGRGNTAVLSLCAAAMRGEAIATEAHRAATVEQGAVHEGAGPQDIAQGPSQ